jgi:hypothetical protein
MRQRLENIRFISTEAYCDRAHVVTSEEVLMVLCRMPEETWQRLREVHFTDRSRGVRRLGYVQASRREISLCALPPRVSLTRFLVKGQSPATFGARRGMQWPHLAVRRFMLYDVLLHELGHMQIVDEKATSVRRRFADEKYAQMFADQWRKTLWREHYDHPDPVHNAPSPDEAAMILQV